MATTHGLGSQRSRWHAPLGRMVRQVAEVVGVTPMDGGRTRLVTRIRQRYAARPATALTIFLSEFGDFAMMRKRHFGEIPG